MVLLFLGCAPAPVDRATPWGSLNAAAEGPEPGPAPLYEPIHEGAPGAWTPNRVVGTHLQGVSYYGRNFQPGIMIYGAPVSRSPLTSGAQSVVMTTYIFKRDASGGMMTETSDQQTVVIPAGATGAHLGNDSWMLTGGAKVVNHHVAWYDEVGRLLGASGAFMNASGDYMCITDFTRACTVYEGFVTVVEPF